MRALSHYGSLLKRLVSLVFLGQMFGENLRVLFLSSTIPLASGIASVTLDRAFFILSGAVSQYRRSSCSTCRMAAAPCSLAVCGTVGINITESHFFGGGCCAAASSRSFRSGAALRPHPVSAWLD